MPVASFARYHDDSLELNGLIASLDGKIILKDCRRGTAAEAEEIGHQLADSLLQAGGTEILDQIRDAGER